MNKLYCQTKLGSRNAAETEMWRKRKRNIWPLTLAQTPIPCRNICRRSNLLSQLPICCIGHLQKQSRQSMSPAPSAAGER